MLKHVSFGVAASAVALLMAPPAEAQSEASFPSKPVRIYGQGAGSTADYMSRFIGKELQAKWGQPFVVDNQAGAGGTIAAAAVARSAPDGYNLIMGHAGPMVSAVSLYKPLAYDPLKDLQPVALVCTGAVVLVTNPGKMSAATAAEFMAQVKSAPTKTFYASAGNGSASHLAMALLEVENQVTLRHVPYKSAGQALNALLAGDVSASFLSAVTANAQLKAGKVRPLVVASPQRFPSLPDVPSAKEAGVKGIDQAYLWFGLFAAAKTPPGIVKKLNDEINAILRRPETVQVFLEQGAVPAPRAPDELGQLVKEQLALWTPFIENNKITAN